MTNLNLRQEERELEKDLQEIERTEKFLEREERRRTKKNLEEDRARMRKRKERTRRLIVLGARLEEVAKSLGADADNLTEKDWNKFFSDDGFFLRQWLRLSVAGCETPQRS